MYDGLKLLQGQQFYPVEGITNNKKEGMKRKKKKREEKRNETKRNKMKRKEKKRKIQ